MERRFGMKRATWRDVLTGAQLSDPEGWELVAPGGIVAWRIHTALTPAHRLRGLLGRRRLQHGEALVLWPCAQIHTLGMHYAIDAVFCDLGLNVLAAETLPPGRMTKPVRRAKVCIELPEGTIAAGAISRGCTLSLAAPAGPPSGA